MEIFTFAPSDFQNQFRSRGYVHARGGVAPSLLEYAREQQLRFEQEVNDGSAPFRERDFALPDAEGTLAGLFDSVAALCDLERSKMTLAECQLKAYSHSASPLPALHKDRLASEVAIGIPLRVAPESRFVIYPDRELEPNPFGSSLQWHRSLDPARTPQVSLDGIPPVEIDVRPGDAVLFQGSRAYHGRTHGAGATILYFKLNALRLDPAAADASTRQQRRNGVMLFDQLRDDEWLTAVVEVSPRLTEVRRHYTRDGWREILLASVHGERDFRLTELGFRLLSSLRGAAVVQQLFQELAVPDRQQAEVIAELRRMVRFGAIDLIEPMAPPA